MCVCLLGNDVHMTFRREVLVSGLYNAHKITPIAHRMRRSTQSMDRKLDDISGERERDRGSLVIALKAVKGSSMRCSLPRSQKARVQSLISCRDTKSPWDSPQSCGTPFLISLSLSLSHTGPRAPRVVLPDGALCSPTFCHSL